MDLNKLKQLTQDAESNLPQRLKDELLQYCNPKRIAEMMLNELEAEATKKAKEEERRASINIDYNRIDGYAKATSKYSSYDIKVKMANILVDMVKSHISDKNIRLEYWDTFRMNHVENHFAGFGLEVNW